MIFRNPALPIQEAPAQNGRALSFRRLRRIAGVTLVIAAASLSVGPALAASRIKDIATFEGVRDNLLVGYGLVVGRLLEWTEPGPVTFIIYPGSSPEWPTMCQSPLRMP